MTLAAQYREQFPVTEKFVYLNHAAVAPISRRCAEAMQRLAEDVLYHGSLHYDTWLDAYSRLRVAAAQLIQAKKSEIAIVKNTSEGIAAVAMGLDWRAGDKVIVFQDEFPANFIPWKALEEKGVRLEVLPAEASLDQIAEAAEGAKLLAISFVQYLSGVRADLESIGEICQRRGVFFFVDAIQGLGAFPLDVRKAQIDALAADGHKWLLGPEGCGILYVAEAMQERIRPAEIGWTNVAGYYEFASHDLSWRPDAGRYECGTLNTIGCFGLSAAIELVLEIGVERIAPAVQALGDQIAAAAQDKGYTLAANRTRANGAGIVSFQKEGLDSRLLVRDLKQLGFLAAPRQGWVRMAPHFYISPEEIERVTEALP